MGSKGLEHDMLLGSTNYYLLIGNLLDLKKDMYVSQVLNNQDFNNFVKRGIIT